ncbi:DUF3939 domain-containing protein [Guptibacillus algicola]|uniref:DUF3939 domain-containing protein n=1 Tax=Guptibacillus algicola TaxID=225844 RepID=UPI001CD266E8|nr:DUF3939 domain-containing protein [Alkalihalobacillus algicola]MCA0986347.1 DUF3939 domain-containing protein [Alkalihalobacillus algicola]
MSLFRKRKEKDKNLSKEYNVIDVSLDDIRKAVGEFANQKREGISLKVLVLNDNRIDMTLLAPFLHGLPSTPFYMSRETFELFSEQDREIPLWIDRMQKAVDAYVRLEDEFPIIEGDPYYKVSFYKLEKKALLQERPPFDFYLTSEEHMVSHRKPEKK